MGDLGFLNASAKNTKVQDEVWKALKRSEPSDEVKVLNIKILLTAVLNFTYAWMKVQEPEPVEGEEPRPKKKVNIENVG